MNLDETAQQNSVDVTAVIDTKVNKEEEKENIINGNIGKIIYVIMKKYVNYLVSDLVFDEKSQLKKHVAELVGAAMDNGDCSIATMDMLMKYVDEKRILDKTRQATNAYEKLVGKVISKSIAEMTISDAYEPSDLIETMQRYKTLLFEKEKLEDKLDNMLWTKVEPTVKSFFVKYSKYINKDYITKFKA
jgi:hypothetical protein